MSVRVFRGGAAISGVPADSRGLAYGDGLFETMRLHAGSVPWFEAHWARLQAGAARLALPLPARGAVERAIADAGAGRCDGVVKLLVSRGAGPRGYAPDPDAEPLWLVSGHDAPPPARPGGLRLRWCSLRLAQQPALAGIKHCNRLEQVLARAEWTGDDFDEGLLRAADGAVACATAANVFVLRDGGWLTPPVDRCGVAGVCRGWALSALQARVAPLSVRMVEDADAIFLCSAVRGILPVASLGERRWPLHAALADAMRRLAAQHPAFADALETP